MFSRATTESSPACARSFRLPEQADDNAISASARDGVLAVVIAKRPENQRRRIEIQAA